MKKEYMKKRLIDYCRSHEYVFQLYNTGVVEIDLPSQRLYPSLSFAYKVVIIDGAIEDCLSVVDYDYKGWKLPF